MTQPSTKAQGLRILVAEDNLVVQHVIGFMLRSLGYEATMVDTGTAAVAAVQYQRYDLVLMDVRMPEMNGLDATRQIRRSLPLEAQPHIYALTAGVAPDEHQECIDAGMEGFLTKPVRPDELADLFAKLQRNDG